MLRDNSITVYISHRVHGFGSSFVSVCVARKKTGRRRGRWTLCVKEEDMRVRVMVVEEREEKGRRKAGEEEEREKIDEGKNELAVLGCIGIV